MRPAGIFFQIVFKSGHKHKLYQRNQGRVDVLKIELRCAPFDSA